MKPIARWPSAVALSLVVVAVGCKSQLELATARAQGSPDKPLVIMATADWCGPCKIFKKRVLPSPRVQAALRDVDFVMLDQKRAKGSLARLGVRGYPTFLVVRPDQRVVARVRGAVGVRTFVSFLTWATPRWFTADTIESELGSRPGIRMKLYAARFFALHGDSQRTRTLYESVLASLGPSDEWRRDRVVSELDLVADRDSYSRLLRRYRMTR